MKNKTRIVYKKSLAMELMSYGARLNKAEPNKFQPNLLVFFFYDDENLKSAFDKVNNNRKIKTSY